MNRNEDLEETNEGLRGMPVHRPPYPVTQGLFGAPTVINNVKTLTTVPPIIEKGPDWFRGIGTRNSPGTAVFSVVGEVVHPGLAEIPMGVTLRTLIFDICGGIPNQKKIKAVQIGGPSGGCLPQEFLDTPIDFDSLRQAGAMMGSGGKSTGLGVHHPGCGRYGSCHRHTGSETFTAFGPASCAVGSRHRL